jgi:hypothetical protein
LFLPFEARSTPSRSSGTCTDEGRTINSRASFRLQHGFTHIGLENVRVGNGEPSKRSRVVSMMVILPRCSDIRPNWIKRVSRWRTHLFKSGRQRIHPWNRHRMLGPLGHQE